MRLSIKRKQVLGVTAMVAMVVTALSLLHLANLARVLLDESRARAELLANGVYHQAREVVTGRESAYTELRSSRSVQSALEAAIYSQDVTDAMIVDPTGVVITSTDPMQVGATLPRRMPLSRILAENGLGQVRAVYGTEQTLEWTQPIALGDQPFGEIRIGLSTLLVRRDLDRSLAPAVLAASVSLLVAVIVAIVLAQVVLRPMHVIRSGLTRLGRGELGATLDLRDEEFRDIGDVFDRVSAQLRAAGPAAGERANLASLSRNVDFLGKLTKDVTHEVKNPLNAMTIHLELLKQKVSRADQAAVLPHLDVIGREIRRLAEVVDHFFRFVRIDHVSFATISMAPLLSNVLDAVAPEAHRGGVTLVRACTDPTLRVEGDAALLREAFVNLAQNAIHAMPKGGRLSIGCAPAANGRVRIRVEDTGLGISAENLLKIFDPYFTTKAHGTGMGLAGVYRTVILHNGTIDAESTVGVGTAFVVMLPTSSLQSR